jgi:hypothetical protein
LRERGVTVVTTSMNFDGPFCSFIASRGLVVMPMHLSVAAWRRGCRSRTGRWT